MCHPQETGKAVRVRVCISVQGSRCVFVTLPVSLCKSMYMCVPVVSDWDRHGAPAGSWAQASVSHLALVTDVWLQALL